MVAYTQQKLEQGDDFYRDSNSLVYGQYDKVDPERLEAMVQDLKKQYLLFFMRSFFLMFFFFCHPPSTGPTQRSAESRPRIPTPTSTTSTTATSGSTSQSRAHLMLTPTTSRTTLSVAQLCKGMCVFFFFFIITDGLSEILDLSTVQNFFLSVVTDPIVGNFRHVILYMFCVFFPH